MTSSGGERSPAPTLREKSTWTPKHNAVANETIFHERLQLIKKWYSAWSPNQRWQLLEFILLHLADIDLQIIHSLIDPLLPCPPTPPPPEVREDFTHLLPRYLSLRVFAFLDPRSLCRAAQVCWHWNWLCGMNQIWREKCLRYNWFLPSVPNFLDPETTWKRHYVACVRHLHWKPPRPPSPEPSLSPSLPAPLPSPFIPPVSPNKPRKSVTRHKVAKPLPPWRHSSRRPSELEKTTLNNSSIIDARLLSTKLTSKNQPNVANFSVPHVASLSGLSNDRVDGTNSSCSISAVSKSLFLSSENENQASISQRPSVPLAAVLHPSLMEKLRLGSPSAENILLSTIHHPEKEDGVNLAQTVHRVQSSSPFPKLPPYYHLSLQRSQSPPDLLSKSNGDTSPPHSSSLANLSLVKPEAHKIPNRTPPMRDEGDTLFRCGSTKGLARMSSSSWIKPNTEKPKSKDSDPIRAWTSDDFLPDSDSD